MTTSPTDVAPQPLAAPEDPFRSSDEEKTDVTEPSDQAEANGSTLKAIDSADTNRQADSSPAKTREQASRLEDNLALLRAEQDVSRAADGGPGGDLAYTKSNSRVRVHRVEPADDFDIATNPLHETTAKFTPPKDPSTQVAKLVKRLHGSFFIVRYFAYITPLAVVILIPLLLGALVYPQATVGGVRLFWFSVWLETVWLTLWAGRIVAIVLPYPLTTVASIFSNNSKKWRNLACKLEVPATIFFWWLAIQISFMPMMSDHHHDGRRNSRPWVTTTNKVIHAIFAGATLNFVEKLVVQLILMDFHRRTYSHRIDTVKFQVAILTKLYHYSKQKIQMDDSDFEEHDVDQGSGVATPLQYISKVQKGAREVSHRVGDVAGKLAQDFTGQRVVQSTDPHQVVVTLLRTPKDSQALARRLYHTFARPDTDTFFPQDLRPAFDNDDEAEAAFQMLDKDLNGDVSMEELEAVCVETGREKRSITNAIKDIDSVVAKLDHVLIFLVLIITVLVLLTLISSSTAGVLASAGSTLLALSWLFSATAQEFLQSVVFVFVKHPFDVGDRVSIYGNTGALGKGDDYFVKTISLLYTEFKKLEGHVVQAPNSYLNTLFILNMRRSGGLAEGVPIVVKFGTGLDQIDGLRQRLLDFVLTEKRDYQGKILTELREVDQAHAVTLNVVFFYKSNWQNELLRLQRRNKFICALMVAMQELGIEGPRMRYPGQKEDAPFYLSGLPFMGGVRPTSTESRPGSESSHRHHHQKQEQQQQQRQQYQGQLATNASGMDGPGLVEPNRPGFHHRGERSRAESIAVASRRVDFSLGMQAMASDDLMSDLYDDPDRNQRLATTNMTASSFGNGRVRASTQSDGVGSTTAREGIIIKPGRASGESVDIDDDHNNVNNGGRAGSRHRFFGRGQRDQHGRADDADLETGGGAVMPDIPENPVPAKGHGVRFVGHGTRTMTAGAITPGNNSIMMGSVGRPPRRSATEHH